MKRFEKTVKRGISCFWDVIQLMRHWWWCKSSCCKGVTIQRREDWFQDSWIRLKVWQIFWKFMTKLSFSWLHNCQKLPCQREMAWHSDKDKFFADCNLIWVAIKVFDCKKAKIIFVHISQWCCLFSSCQLVLGRVQGLFISRHFQSSGRRAENPN